ncbi:MAG: phospholipase D family protein [Treponematales bacterium]
MSFQLLKSPFSTGFSTLVKKAERELLLVSPFINETGVKFLLDLTTDKTSLKVNVLTNFSARNIVADVTQPSALLQIYDAFEHTTVWSLARLHAKIYVADDTLAVITSANLTIGGLRGNFEYGVLVDDVLMVRNIKHDVLDYAALGSTFDRPLVENINRKRTEIGRLKSSREYTDNLSAVSKILKNAEQQIETNLLTNTVREGRTINSIFLKLSSICCPITEN